MAAKNDPRLNDLLKWSIANTSTSATAVYSASQDANSTTEPTTQHQKMDPELLEKILGGPSDADLMKQSIEALMSNRLDLEAKLVAFDNFEQLIENLDNANNMEPLGLWDPLITLLAHKDAQMRIMAAWCCSTAVQNNISSQRAMLAHGGLGHLVEMALKDTDEKARKKAVSAISSGIRNFPPGVKEVIFCVPSRLVPEKKLDPEDMAAIDAFLDTLRKEGAK